MPGRFRLPSTSRKHGPRLEQANPSQLLTQFSYLLEDASRSEELIDFINKNKNILQLQDNDGLTAAQICMSCNRYDIFKKILEVGNIHNIGCDVVIAALDKNRSCFATNILKDFPRILQMEAKKSMESLVSFGFRLIRVINKDLHEVFADALGYLNQDQLKYLLSSRDENNCLLLHWSCYSSLTYKIIKLSIDNGVDILSVDGSGFLPIQRLSCSSLPSTSSSNEEFKSNRRIVILNIILLTLQKYMEVKPKMTLLEALEELFSTRLNTNVQTIMYLNGSNFLNLAASTNNKEFIYIVLQLLQVFGTNELNNLISSPDHNDQLCKEKDRKQKEDIKDNNSDNIKQNLKKEPFIANIDLLKQILNLKRDKVLSFYYNIFFCQTDNTGKTVYMTIATKGDFYTFGLISSSLTSKTPENILKQALLSVDKLGRGICHLSMHANSTAIINIISSTIQRLKEESEINKSDGNNLWLITGPNVQGKGNSGLNLKDLLNEYCVTSTNKHPSDILPLDKEKGEGKLTLADVNIYRSHPKTKELKQEKRKIAKELKKRNIVVTNVFEYGKKVSDDREVSNRVKCLISPVSMFFDKYFMVMLITALYLISSILGYVFEKDLLFSISFFSLCLYHLYVVRLNPGVIKKRNFIPMEDFEGHENRHNIVESIRNKAICPTCLIPKGDKTGIKHCPYCNHCVIGFDHCCPWIGNDVGAGNHRQFIILLIFGVILDLIFGIKYVAKVVGYMKILMKVNKLQIKYRSGRTLMQEVNEIRRRTNLEVFKASYFVFWNFLIGIWCLFLLIDQIFYIVNDTSLNKTIKDQKNPITNENKKLERILGKRGDETDNGVYSEKGSKDSNCNNDKKKKKNPKASDNNTNIKDEGNPDVYQEEKDNTITKTGKIGKILAFFSGERARMQIKCLEEGF